MSWNNIIAQQRVKDLIRNAVKHNRLPHALLFYGPQGVGKDAVAIQLAKVMNCQYGELDSCDNCPDCKQFDHLQHPNLNLLFTLPVGKNEDSSSSPTEKLTQEDIKNIISQLELKSKNLYHKITIERANTIKISSIREIRRKSALSISNKQKRFVIIMNAEDLSVESSNALLKTLEEPPQNTILILTTFNKDSLLPTIVSRCQLIRFDKLTENQIKEALITQQKVNEQQSNLIARLADGSYRHALELINSDIFEKRAKVVEFLAMVLTSNTTKISQEVERFIKSTDKAGIEEFFLLLNLWFRDVIALQEGSDHIINTDIKERMDKFLKLYPMGNFQYIVKSIEKSISLIQKNVYIQLLLTCFIITIRKTLLVKNNE